jgi:hypothetical protein
LAQKKGKNKLHTAYLRRDMKNFQEKAENAKKVKIRVDATYRAKIVHPLTTPYNFCQRPIAIPDIR